MAITVAFEMSASYMSPCTKAALSATPFSRAACCRDLDQLRVELHAKGARAAVRGGDDVAAVAGPQVDDVVVLRHLRQIEHRLDELRRRRHPDHVLAGLADARLVGAGRRRRCRGRGWADRRLGRRGAGNDQRQQRRQGERPEADRHDAGTAFTSSASGTTGPCSGTMRSTRSLRVRICSSRLAAYGCRVPPGLNASASISTRSRGR